MQPEDIVRSGPNQYVCREGIAKELPSFANAFERPVIITGVKSFKAFTSYTTPPNDWKVVQHTGCSSLNKIKKAAEAAESADVIIGIGGGTVLDTA
ncbi:iron-containing alcohol dehydrogenase, partial [Bacillus paralicheniformis]